MTNKIIALLVLGAAFAVLKAAAIVLVVALLLSLLLVFIARPVGTLALLGVLSLLGLATAQPLASIITLGVVGVMVAVMGARRKPRNLALLTDGREHHSN